MNYYNDLREQLYLSEADYVSYIRTLPFRYKRYYIPKRNSAEKRLIAQPARTVKTIQKYLVENLSTKLSVHRCATAYQVGTGIKLNASRHQKNPYILKMDFSNFFESITPEILIERLKEAQINLTEEELFLFEHVFFWRKSRKGSLRLSVGAPSSPFISNTVMFSFDKKIEENCQRQGVVYTRYADDMAFSTNKKDTLKDVEKLVYKTLKECFGRAIKVNRKKTVFTSKKFNRHITGVTITNENELSIGRGKKRLLHSKVHHFSKGILTDEEALQLKGELGFAKHIEPLFIEKLELKYGNEIIDKLKKFNL